MRTVVVTDPPRADLPTATALGEHGVATVHEAQGRTGCLGPEFRPAWPGASRWPRRGSPSRVLPARSVPVSSGG